MAKQTNALRDANGENGFSGVRHRGSHGRAAILLPIASSELRRLPGRAFAACVERSAKRVAAGGNPVVAQ